MLKFTIGQPNMIDFLYVNHIWLTIVKSTKTEGFIKKPGRVDFLQYQITDKEGK